MRRRVSYVVIVLVVILAACSGRASRLPFEMTSGAALISALRSLQGDLRLHPTASEIAIYFDPASTRDSALYEAAIARADSHLETLVECIADTLPAQVRYQDRGVSRGAVCWWVLWNTSWFDRQLPAHGAGPDVPLDTVDAEAQRRARDYWRARLERRTVKEVSGRCHLTCVAAVRRDRHHYEKLASSARLPRASRLAPRDACS